MKQDRQNITKPYNTDSETKIITSGTGDSSETCLSSSSYLLLKILSDGSIIHASNSSALILGKKPRELAGSKLNRFITEESYRYFTKNFLSSKDQVVQGEPLYLELDFIHNSGRLVPCEMVMSGQPGEYNGPILYCVVRDLSQDKGCQSLLETQKNIVDEFIYTLSHELKNPLRNLKGYLHVVEGDLELFQKYRSRLLNQADYLIKLVDRLSSLSQYGSGPLETAPLHLDQIIRQVFLTSKLHPNSRIDIQEGFPPVIADMFCMQQLFSNLIENSIKFHDPQKDHHLIEVSYNRKGIQLEIILKDNGIGVERKNLEKIFIPGYTRDRDHGTGFGLAIARKILQVHGGTIRAESEGPGLGTSFIICIPRDGSLGNSLDRRDESGDPENNPWHLPPM